MRVVIFNESSAWGGLEAHAVDLTDALCAAGHEVVVACIDPRGCDLYRAQLPGHVQVVSCVPDGPRTWRSWSRALRGIQGDAAIFEKGTLHAGGLALDLVLARRFRKFIVIQQLEPPVLPPKSTQRYLNGLVPGLGLWWHKWRWTGFARSLAPSRTVCVSDAVRRALATDYRMSERRLLTIHNGVDLDRFAPNAAHRANARQAWGVPEGAFVFGSVRRFVPEKGLDVAIEAFAQAARTDATARLVLVGDGPEFANLVALAQRLGVSDRVVFAGFRSDAWSLYPGFDSFLIPSRVEAQGIVVLEAMASGCVVIGSRVGGIPEMISRPELGLLVAPGDVAALAGAMQTALHMNADDRAVMARAARDVVVRQFDARVQCRRIAALLEGEEPNARAVAVAPS